MRTNCQEVQKRLREEFFLVLRERLGAAFGQVMTPHSLHLGECKECMALYQARMEENQAPHHRAFSAALDNVLYGAWR